MSDREDRSNRLQTRFEDEQEEESKTDKPSKTEQTGEPAEPEQSEQTSVKDRPSVLMYLPEDQHTELDIRFDELNAKHKRKHGEALQKNRDYYPAVIESALESKDLEAVLDIQDS